MPDFTWHAFSSGAIDPLAAARDDVDRLRRGAAVLDNLLIDPTGAVFKRPGFRRIAALPVQAAARLRSFEYSSTARYLLVFSDDRLDILPVATETFLPSVASPFKGAALAGLSTARAGRVMVMTDQANGIRELTLDRFGAWAMNQITWKTDPTTGRIAQPHRKYADPAVTLATSATTGTVTVTASAPLFRPSHVGTRFRRQNKELEITGIGLFAGEYAVTAYVGDMTFYSPGLSRAFDGDQATYVGAYATGAAGAYNPTFAGADFGGSPKRIGLATVTASPWGFCYYSSGTGLRLELRASNSAPASATAGTLLGSIDLGTDAAAYSSHTISSGDQTSDWRYVWIAVVSPSEYFKMLSDVRLFAPGGDYESLTATAVVKETQVGSAATAEWTEQAFSAARGWPAAVCHHKGRRVLAGGAEPTALWFSTARDLTEFEVGAGDPDDSVYFTGIADSLDEMRQLVSMQDRLLAFSSTNLWALGDSVITPETPGPSVSMNAPAADTPPFRLDGSVIYVGEAQEGAIGIYSVAYDAVRESFTRANLTRLAGHLLREPRQIAYRHGDQTRDMSHLFVVEADGSVPALNAVPEEKIAGWSRLSLQGADVHSVCVIGTRLYAVIERSGAWTLEVMDGQACLDGAVFGTSATPKQDWTGLPADFNGKTVRVVGDGWRIEDVTVTAGTVTLAQAAAKVEIGFPVVWAFETLSPPFTALLAPRAGANRILSEAAISFHQSAGVIDDADREVLAPDLEWLALDSPPKLFTGIRVVPVHRETVALQGSLPWPVMIRAVKVWW